jgi:hypothetical protein
MMVTSVVTLSACPDEQPPNNNTLADAAIAADAAEPEDAGLLAHAERCARGAALPVIGDMNGDGTTDIAGPRDSTMDWPKGQGRMTTLCAGACAGRSRLRPARHRFVDRIRAASDVFGGPDGRGGVS